jgi:hypothetical protein
MKMTLPALVCLWFAAPGFAGNPAPVLNAGQFCGEQASKMRDALLAGGDVADSIRRLTELFTDVNVCTCTQSKLSASPYPVRSDDAGLRRYMRANADCLAGHIAAKFPASCPATYADLLPRMGYRTATPVQVTGMCQCAADTFAKKLTSTVLYDSMVDAYEEANARLAAGSNPVFDAKKSPRPQPMEIAFQELQSCGAKVLGPAR